MAKLYYYDKIKKRYIVRIQHDGKNKQLGSYKTEQEAIAKAEEYKATPVGARAAIARATTDVEQETYTLAQSIVFIDDLANPQKTKENYIRYLTGLVANWKEDDEYMNLTSEELAKRHADVDIMPLVQDVDTVLDLIENTIKNKRTGGEISIDTKKHYIQSVYAVMNPRYKDHIKVKGSLRTKYSELVKEYDAKSNQKRNTHTRRGGMAENREFDWPFAVEKYTEFLNDGSFENSGQGNNSLAAALITGLYVLHRPRRVKDYALLQYYSEKPTDNEMKDKNIVVLTDDKATFYIDNFKTRYITRYKKKAREELLETYVKEVNGQLASLLRDYIERFKVVDMTHASDDKQHFIFTSNTIDDGLSEKDLAKTISKMDDAFGKRVSYALRTVYKLNKLTVNSMRHAFNDWIAKHFNEYTDAQHQAIAIDVGDKPTRMQSNIRYRYANENNVDKDNTQIQDELIGMEQANRMAREDMEEEASVGAPEPLQDITEMEAPTNVGNDSTLRELYEKYGMLYFSLKKIEMQIMQKLNE
jgi:hypothetical protein